MMKAIVNIEFVGDLHEKVSIPCCMGIGKPSIDLAVFEIEQTAHSSHPIEGLVPFREWRLFGTGMA